MSKKSIDQLIRNLITEVLFVTGVKVKELSLQKALVLDRHDEELVELEEIGDLSSGTRLHLDAQVEHKGSIKTLTAKVFIKHDGTIEVQNFNIETTEIDPLDVEDSTLTKKAIEMLKKYEEELQTIISGALKIAIEYIKMKQG